GGPHRRGRHRAWPPRDLAVRTVGGRRPRPDRIFRGGPGLPGPPRASRRRRDGRGGISMNDPLDPSAVRFRRPTEADHAPIVALVDEWWGGRRMRDLLLRLWFQHFTGTSWIAEDDEGRLLGFLVGFISPDDPDTAYVHMIATNPNRRRSGLGAALYRRFFDDVGGRGVRRVRWITWLGNR